MAKLNLLRLIKIMCEGCAQYCEHIARSSLRMTVERLSKQDDAVLVRQVSKPHEREDQSLTADFSLRGRLCHYWENRHQPPGLSALTRQPACGPRRHHIHRVERKSPTASRERITSSECTCSSSPQIMLELTGSSAHATIHLMGQGEQQVSMLEGSKPTRAAVGTAAQRTPHGLKC
jgi:hypothetical protein